MILKATRNGVSEERIAKVLKVDIASIEQKRDLLNGICKEAAEHTEESTCVVGGILPSQKNETNAPDRSSRTVLASTNFSVPYAKALLAATQVGHAS